MGCVISSPNSNWSEDGNESLSIGSREKFLMENAVSSSGGSAYVSVFEKAREKSPPKEGGSFSLPEGKFKDGRLGITEMNQVQEMMTMISTGELFIDREFTPTDDSLYFVPDTNNEDNEIEWKRPHELVNNPEVFVEGVNRRDVVQGELPDCWFLSSCAAVARRQKLIERVIFPNQSLKGEDYKGMIICRFWRFGEWVTVCIDDMLPTKRGKLIHARSEDPDEFWISLLEKAYAKLHGSYQALGGGQSMDAMVDLTGGIAERVNLDETEKKNLFNYIRTASQNGAFITTSRQDGDWRSSHKADANGLVPGHAYTVSGVAKVDHAKKGIVTLIRMRNPWGNEAEWTGRWSDGDVMWDDVSTHTRRRLLRDNSRDGEFWMSFDDFFKEFEEISLCFLQPDFNQDGVIDKAGMVLAIKGSWELGKNAGGSKNTISKFATNPQFLLTVEEINGNIIPEDDEKDDHKESTKKSFVLIGLIQEHRQSIKNEKVKLNQIAISVYEIEDPNTRLSRISFYTQSSVGSTKIYINYREVICRLELNPGHYVIIPATFEADIEGSFMVRVYSSNNFDLRSLH